MAFSVKGRQWRWRKGKRGRADENHEKPTIFGKMKKRVETKNPSENSRNAANRYEDRSPSNNKRFMQKLQRTAPGSGGFLGRSGGAGGQNLTS